MRSHGKKWYTAGRKINATDKMLRFIGGSGSYTYTLTFKAGTSIHDGGVDKSGNTIRYDTFNPAYTPQQMLVMGVFEGKYINDCENEFPIEWYDAARKRNKLSPDKADPSKNKFGQKSRLSMAEWLKRGWIPVDDKDRDVRGWFQWYCRYWIGRRIPDVDSIQIKRWKSFKRHYVQVKKNAKGDLTKRRKQRQALLQWSWDCTV
jgi:hypothetical protein